MIKEIKYNGFTSVPSDYECPDGDLAASINIVPEDGQLKIINQPTVIMTLHSTSQRVLYIHEATGYKHYIIYDASTYKILWLNGLTGSPVEIGSFYDVTHCNSVGNTLLIFTKTNIHYLLWKDTEYKNLGTHLPNIEVSFGLVGHPRLFSVSDKDKSTFTVNFAEKLSIWDSYTELSEANKTAVTEQVMAKVNRFIREQSIDKGRFCFPFFVRYALRLYDGSLVCHSAPILMNPQTLPAPLVLWGGAKGKDGYSEAYGCDIMLVACDLDYKVLHTGDYYKLDDWSYIVTGIEVFISKPIYTYEQEGKISSLRDTDNFDSTFIGRIYHKNYHRGGVPQYPTSVTEDCILGPMADGQTADYLNCYAEWTYKRLYALYFSADHTYPSHTFHMPELSDEKIGESLRSCSHFFKLRTLALADIKETERKVIAIEDDYLQSLVAREVMTDDYLTHDPLSATSSQVYNSRLNLSGVKRSLFNGFSASSMFAFTDRFIGTWQVEDGKIKVLPSIFADSVRIGIFIKEGGKVHYVTTEGECGAFLSPTVQEKKPNIENEYSDMLVKLSTGCYIFYPNVNATTAVISSVYGDSGSPYGGGSMVIELKPHDFLNGAYALLDYNVERKHNYSSNLVPQITPAPYGEINTVDCGSKVYTSEVNNPFFFPVTGINTIGTGRILGIATAAKALSQGQFGQFPLYAFTTDGVWAMEVSANGTFSAKQPITRDVCVNPDGITQIDSAVLFPTDRGIMLISGSQTQCISDVITNDVEFDVRSLPGMDRLHAMIGHGEDSCFPVVPFLDFIFSCGMVYDYLHQRIIVFNKAYSYAYVYSLKSKKWGMTFSRIANTINSYPEALAVDTGGSLVDFSKESEDRQIGLLVTRPLKLGEADILKTIDTLMQRGVFRDGHVKSALYGSRDLFTWHLVNSSVSHRILNRRGTPYKYFRIALVCDLDTDETVCGCSVQYTPRFTNRLR